MTMIRSPGRSPVTFGALHVRSFAARRWPILGVAISTSTAAMGSSAARGFVRYAARQCRVLKPKSVNCTLSSLRQFLRFMHLRGACSPTLVHAIPCVADFGRQVGPEVLNEVQRRTFLAAFDRKSGEGRHDYAIALCLIDLGLRAIEVARLRVGDLDWQHHTMAVPPAKTSRGRQLPLPPHVGLAMRHNNMRRKHCSNVTAAFEDYLHVVTLSHNSRCHITVVRQELQPRATLVAEGEHPRAKHFRTQLRARQLGEAFVAEP